jgi:2-polyprenyl-3-methyl-5-hydroxy-6-metoxy-1,4-benzoquinol methylase
MDYNLKSETYFGLTRQEMISYVPLDAINILEAGCGSGQFGSALKQQNPLRIVDGVEPFESTAKQASGVLDSVFTGSVEAFLSQVSDARKYDCIIFNDVLEHLYDPWQVLKDCRRILNSGGCIVSSIPNIRYFPVFVQFLKYGEWKYVEAGVMDFTHIRFFTRKSMIHMYQSSGYQIELIQGINATKSSQYKWFKMMTLNRMPDVEFQQFAIRATLL